MTETTLDQAEVAKFSARADDWWDESGPMAPLHRMNPVRLEYIRRVVSRRLVRPDQGLTPFEGLTALDIGCGAGLLSEPLARMGFGVTGIDPSFDVIAVARAHAEAQELSLTYRAATVEEFGDSPAGAAGFDVVFALEVVEHLPDVPAFIAAAARLVRPGGVFIASTLNRTAKALALAIVGAEYIMRWLPVGTHEFKRFVRPGELSDALAASGLTEIDRTGLVYNPLVRAWKMSGDMSVNYIMSAVR